MFSFSLNRDDISVQIATETAKSANAAVSVLDEAMDVHSVKPPKERIGHQYVTTVRFFASDQLDKADDILTNIYRIIHQ